MFLYSSVWPLYHQHIMFSWGKCGKTMIKQHSFEMFWVPHFQTASKAIPWEIEIGHVSCVSSLITEESSSKVLPNDIELIDLCQLQCKVTNTTWSSGRMMHSDVQTRYPGSICYVHNLWAMTMSQRSKKAKKDTTLATVRSVLLFKV